MKLYPSAAYMVVGTVLGVCTYGFGGYIAAALAAGRGVSHGVAAGAAAVLYAVIAYSMPYSSLLSDRAIVALLLPIPATTLGAFIYSRRHRA